MIPRYRAYLFDVDGTLLDSATDICAAIRQVLVGTPHEACPEEQLRVYIGRHLHDLFRVLFPELSIEEVEELRLRYRFHYLSRNHCGSSVFPGVREALAGLEGFKATATTKSTPTTRAVLEQFGLLTYFDHVQGTDGFPAKPAPDVLLRAAAALGVAPADCLMVGDAPADILAGKRAGIKTCAVCYGYGRKDELAAAGPDYWVNDLRELL